MLRRTAEVNHRYLPALTNYTVFCRPTALQVGGSGPQIQCSYSAVHLDWCIAVSLCRAVTAHESDEMAPACPKMRGIQHTVIDLLMLWHV